MIFFNTENEHPGNWGPAPERLTITVSLQMYLELYTGSSQVRLRHTIIPQIKIIIIN